jgi:hypothetical protein
MAICDARGNAVGSDQAIAMMIRYPSPPKPARA